MKQTYVVADARGAEVVRWTGDADSVAPLVSHYGTPEAHVELWADGVMVQRNLLGRRDPASLRFVTVAATVATG